MGKVAKKLYSVQRQKPVPKTKNKTSSTSASTSHIAVIANDPGDHPHCERHGPALLFRETFDDGRPAHQFYGCSANRDRKQCRVRESAAELDASAEDDRARSVAFEERLQQNAALFAQIQSLPATDRAYCAQCGRLVPASAIAEHAQHIGLVRTISDHQLGSPTRLLAPLSNDSREAQYFFADTTLLTIERILLAARIRRVVCIGAPRLHEYVREHSERLGGCTSVLLDLDDRLEQFYGRHEFFRFNMFNGWWVDGTKRGEEFDAFLRGDGTTDGDEGSTLLFTDPPFGCRSEPLAQTLHALQHRHAVLRRQPLPAAPLSIMWIFPYFQATYVLRSMPQLQASAYAVNYTNHRAYQAGPGGRKLGSPVRLFTNVPAALAGRSALPAAEGYTLCTPCGDRWLAPGAGQHCARCGECASLNGAAYRHCAACELCVKPSYVHCEPCGRCVLGAGGDRHDCALYRRHAQCWICRRRGHVESECVEWLAGDGRAVRLPGKRPKQAGRVCLVCGRCGHNEKRCAERAVRLDEWTFAGQVFNRFVCDDVTSE